MRGCVFAGVLGCRLNNQHLVSGTRRDDNRANIGPMRMCLRAGPWSVGRAPYCNYGE